MKTTISFFLFLIVSLECYTQEFIYKNFGVDDGLPSSEVYDLYQDEEGYLWFATDKGLSKFNGYKFENFNTNDGITGNVVLRFYPQENGQVWGYSYHNKSLFYFNKTFNGFTPYKYNTVLHKHLANGGTVKSVYVDDENKVHIGGYAINGELIIDPQGESKLKYSTDNYHDPSTTFQKFLVLEKTEKYPFFFSTVDTTLVDKTAVAENYKTARIMAQWLNYDKTGLIMQDSVIKIISQNTPEIVIKEKRSPIGIRVIDSTRFFIGYEFGGAKIVNNKGAVINEFLKDKSVTNFLIDRDGGYWFTTLDSGVYFIENPSIGIYTVSNEKSPHITNLAKTTDGQLLIGYNDGIIAKLPKNRTPIIIDWPKTKRHAFVEHDPQLNKTYLYNDSELKVGEIEKKRILNQHLLKLSEPGNGIIFSSHGVGFFEITKNGVTKDHPLFNRVHDVAIWKKDTLIGTPSGIFKKQQDSLVSLSYLSKLFEYRVEDIDVSQDHTLFVATQGAGVIVNDNGRIYNITKKEGLNSDIINEILIENDTTIWVCTNSGINRIDFENDDTIITGISTKEGLLSNEIEDLEIINDTVWAGTKQGLCYFPKSQLNPKKVNGFNLKIKEVYVNDQLRTATDQEVLTYRENKINFVLEGVAFANSDDLQYQYRLNSVYWSSTKSRTIQFASLSPGSYYFEAKMCLNDQNCSEKKVSYHFIIQTPFWKKWWFTLLWLLALALLVYLFFKVRVLTYNRDITRELIRLMVKQLKRKEKHFSFKENGNEVRIKTQDILFIKSSGNYIDISTENKTHTVRMNIGKFLNHVPDKLEYIRVHRSYIVRIDKITSKSKNEVCIGDQKLPVSQSYLQNLKDVHF